MNVGTDSLRKKGYGKVPCVLHKTVERIHTLWVMSVVDGDSFTLESFCFTLNLLLCAGRI
jgi:hypothetical protein